MESNSFSFHLDEHLKKIELNAKTALENIEKAGIPLDTTLINHFKKMSIER